MSSFVQLHSSRQAVLSVNNVTTGNHQTSMNKQTIVNVVHLVKWHKALSQNLFTKFHQFELNDSHNTTTHVYLDIYKFGILVQVVQWLNGHCNHIISFFSSCLPGSLPLTSRLAKTMKFGV